MLGGGLTRIPWRDTDAFRFCGLVFTVFKVASVMDGALKGDMKPSSPGVSILWKRITKLEAGGPETDWSARKSRLERGLGSPVRWVRAEDNRQRRGARGRGVAARFQMVSAWSGSVKLP